MRDQLYIDLDETQQACLDYTQAKMILEEVCQRFMAVQETISTGYMRGAFADKIVKDESEIGHYRMTLKLRDFTELVTIAQYSMAKTLEALGYADDYIQRILLNQMFDGMIAEGLMTEGNVTDMLNKEGVEGSYSQFEEMFVEGKPINFDYTTMSEERPVSSGNQHYEDTVSMYDTTPKQVTREAVDLTTSRTMEPTSEAHRSQYERELYESGTYIQKDNYEYSDTTGVLTGETLQPHIRPASHNQAGQTTTHDLSDAANLAVGGAAVAGIVGGMSQSVGNGTTRPTPQNQTSDKNQKHAEEEDEENKDARKEGLKYNHTNLTRPVTNEKIRNETHTTSSLKGNTMNFSSKDERKTDDFTIPTEEDIIYE